MPWRARGVMEERIEFVVKAALAGSNLSRLCREYGVSRTTGYLWHRRYEEAGSVRGLAERSRRPRHSPARTEAVVEQRVEELRRRYGWGGKKLAVLLAAEGTELSEATVNRILRRRGLVEPPAGYGRATTRFERARPNELWQMDFKGQWEIREGWCYPLTMLDDHSRYLVGLRALLGPEGSAVEACLVRSFEAYGVPEAMLMDHGVPWWSTTNGHGLTRVSVGLIRQGIRLYYSGVRHPQTQGKVERLHGTLKRRLGRRGYPANLAACARVLEDFRQEYNQVRPHEALGMQVPAQHDEPSRRAYQPTPRPWEYAPGAAVRRLNTQGCLDYQRRRYFVCEALAGERVSLENLGDKVLVRYQHMYIREIDTLSGRTTAVVLPSPHPPL